MRNMKISTLLKAGILLVLLSFMGCPQSAKGGNDHNTPNNAISQEDIKGDGPAVEGIKNTVWKSKPANGPMSEVELKFAVDSNTCRVELPMAKKFYIAEYEVKDGKINLKLDKNIEFFKNYTVFNMLKGEENEMKEFIADLEKNLADPDFPESKKEALKKQIAIFKEALNSGAFNTQEKFKKFSIELMIPYLIKEMEAQINDPDTPEKVKNDLKEYKKQMEAMLKDPSLFDAYVVGSVEESKKLATYLANANPIILTLPQGQSLETATTMTANKMYVSIENNQPTYRESLEFTRK